ncbi:MAG: hypothetical protein ACLSVK_00885 [Acutalibacteraceae bacterium]|uniref:hypothetical protein n=2 Tax=Candidatus Fimivicinus sp. TaxID=3056640 RepID=UPI003A3B6257
MTDVAKQSLMAAGSGLLKAKGLDSNAVPGSVIAAPELSKNLDNDKIALKEYNSLLAYGATPAEAYAESLMGVSKAAQEAARQSNGLPVDIDKYHNSQLAASMATKVSTGSMIAQSVASAALTGAISMGVTLAVNGLVMGLDYLAHAHERAVEAVDNANQAYAENETELNNASSSLAQVEERLNALNSIQNPSLADKEETAELERQREELTAQVALLKEKGEALKAKQAESSKELMDNLESEGLDSSYSKDGGKLSWWEKIGASMAQGQTMQSASNMMLFDPDMAQQQMDMMDDMSMSAKEYAEYWTDSLSTDGLDRQSEQFQTVRDNLLNIAEEYQKVAQSSDGAIGDAAREKVNQITYALGDAETRADLFNNKLGDNDAKDKLLDAAAAGELTAENLAQIAGDDLASQLNSVSGSAQATVEQLAAMAQTGEQARSAAENLQTATASLAEANQKISDIEGAVNSQRALNASEVSDLCAKYPELQQYVTATADGFAIEEGAMSLLSGATSQFSTGYIQAQIKMSEAALAETQNRINLMQQEAGIMGSLDYATVASKTDKFVMTEHEFRRGNNSKGYESYEQYLASFLDSDLAASYEQSAKLQKAIEDAKKNLKLKQDYEKRAADTAKKNQTKSTSSGSTAYKNEALDNELKRIEHLKAIGKYENDELGYIKALENAKSRLTKKESERWQLEEKIYAAREAYEKQQLDDYLDEISYKEAMGKYDDNQAQKIADLTYAYNKLAKKKEDLRKLEQQIYKETKAYQEAEAKKAKDAADAIEDIVDMRMKYIRKEQELKKKALEDELDGYKKLYDAQAKALDKQKEADDYAKTAAKKRADIAEIETRLNELSADTSAASQREQAELRAELAEKQEDLEEYEKEQSIERQKEKLDEEYALLEEQNNAKIEKIDEFLDNEGAVRDQAMADIMTRSETVYQELMEWNAKYGDGINKTVTDAWKAATDALKTYGTQANAIKISENPGDIKPPVKTPSAAAQQKPAASSGGSSAAKAPVKGGRASVTTKDAAAYASSSGKRVGSWSTMAKNAGVGWNQKLYVTNIANGKVAIGTTSKIGNTIAWVDKKNVKGYRSGSPFIPSDQLALVDEAGPELIIRNPVQGRLTHLSRGDGVLNSTLTERIIALAQNPAAFLNQSMAKLSSAFGAGFAPGAAPCIQIDSKVIVEGNADMETVKALEKAENRIAEKVFTQANKKYLRSGHTINPKHLG